MYARIKTGVTRDGKIIASEEEIHEALSKHLCRCTGYEAIWEAALLAQKRINQL